MGLDKSITSGLISAIRKNKDVVLLQISAPISPGSSGGGGSSVVVLVSQSGCLTGRFDNITVVGSSDGLPVSSNCTTVTAVPTYTPRDLSVAFTTTPVASCCDSVGATPLLETWMIAIIVVASVVFVVIVLGVVFGVPRIRYAIFPYLRRRGEASSAAVPLEPAGTTSLAAVK